MDAPTTLHMRAASMHQRSLFTRVRCLLSGDAAKASNATTKISAFCMLGKEHAASRSRCGHRLRRSACLDKPRLYAAWGGDAERRSSSAEFLLRNAVATLDDVVSKHAQQYHRIRYAHASKLESKMPLLRRARRCWNAREGLDQADIARGALRQLAPCSESVMLLITSALLAPSLTEILAA